VLARGGHATGTHYHESGGAYPDVSNTASRYQEIKQAILHMESHPKL